MFGDFASGVVTFGTVAAAIAAFSNGADRIEGSDLPPPLSATDFIQFDQSKAEVGRLLFYDKLLSGNKNISCGTCHHHDLGGSDGLSLGIGEGGAGLGPERSASDGQTRIHERIPRNAPALWNLGAAEVRVMFHDGRLQISDAYGNGFDSPVDEDLPAGLETILAAQSLFPMTARSEMSGDPGENDIADAVAQASHLAWPIIAARVSEVPEYQRLFTAAFDHVDTPDDITIVDIGNALAAFIGSEWRNHDSPFDRYIAGDTSAMGLQAVRGMDLFYGEAGCATCHSGPLLSDQEHHALSLPEFGPGKTDDGRDPGRYAETGDTADLNAFRTPMLRNVALTAPYGHNGAYSTLEGIVRHHADPARALTAWAIDQAALRPAPWLDDRAAVGARITDLAALASIQPLPLSDHEIGQLVAFLESLTGGTAATRPMGRPETVPSGLDID
ncbi:MAG: methylamine utilization protein MauG [Silicimonas sp.]|nr:methylamine utilization protein MauG [Silicimonas sp.]